MSDRTKQKRKRTAKRRRNGEGTVTFTIAPSTPEPGTIFVHVTEKTAAIMIRGDESCEAIAKLTADAINSEPIDLRARHAELAELVAELGRALDTGWTPDSMRTFKRIEHAARLPEICALVPPARSPLP